MHLLGGEDDVVNVFQMVFFQILLRLPVKCLLRFRCVCKKWCEMIDSGVFKDTYLALRRSMAVDDQLIVIEPRLCKPCVGGDPFRVFPDYVSCWYRDCLSLALDAFACSSSSSSSSSSMDNEFKILAGDYTCFITIINHLDGIVCFIDDVYDCRSTYGNIKHNNWIDITLMNPALGEIRKLPIPVFDLLGGIFKRKVQGIGFGYDDSRNEYKVVAVVTVYEHEDEDGFYKHMGLVYHLRTNCWTILDDIYDFLSKPFSWLPDIEPVFSNGSLHWLIDSINDDYDEDDDDEPFPLSKFRILAFDLTNESFREMPFPHGYTFYSSYDADAKVPRLHPFDKSTIALVAYTGRGYAESVLEIWVMKKYGETDSWTKQYAILADVPGNIRPLCFWKRDKILIVSESFGLICYDLSFEGQPPAVDEPAGAKQCYPPCPMSGIYRKRLKLVPGHESFVSVKQL